MCDTVLERVLLSQVFESIAGFIAQRLTLTTCEVNHISLLQPLTAFVWIHVGFNLVYLQLLDCICFEYLLRQCLKKTQAWVLTFKLLLEGRLNESIL